MADEILSGLKAIKVELKLVQDQMAGLDAGSKEFIKLSEKAGELRDRMKDVKEAVNANAGPAIANFGNNLSIARGQLMELDLEGFGESLKRVGSNIQGIKLSTLKDGLSSLGSGLAAIGKALLTNPIFLIAGTIALIAVNMDKVFKAIPSFEKALKGIGQVEKDIAAAVEARAAASKKAYDQSSLEVNAMKLQGKSEREIAEYRMQRLKTSIADAKVQLTTAEQQRNAQISAAQRNREILEGMLKFLQAPLYLLLKSIDAVANAIPGVTTNLAEGLVDLTASLMVDPDEIQKNLDDNISKQQDAIRQMESDYAGFQLQMREMDKKATETKKENNDKEVEARREKDHYEVEAVKSKEATLVSSAVRTMELQTALTKVTISEEEKRTAAERKAAEERMEIFNSLWYAKYDIAKATTDAMMNLNDALTQSGIISAEKGFKIGKSLSIAQATISTIQGVQNALSAASTIPEPFGTALKAVNAVSIAAAGAANIAKIAKTQFNGGTGSMDKPNVPSPSGGAMGGASSQSPAALNLSGLQGNTSVAPLQTYVLAGQVSGAQQAEFKIKNTASILGAG